MKTLKVALGKKELEILLDFVENHNEDYVMFEIESKEKVWGLSK